MEKLNSQQTLASFMNKLHKSQPRALLLDYDGTLAPFQIEREQAFPYPEVIKVLETIIESGHTRVVLVSGRWIKELIPLLGLKQLPEIWGCYGLEHLQADGTYQIAHLDLPAMQGLIEAENWLVKMGLADYCEHKPGSLAIHWRGQTTEVIKTINDKLWRNLALFIEQADLRVDEFDEGIELRIYKGDKGLVVRSLLQEMGPAAVVAYLGDDLTDECAFKAIKDQGISILVRPQLRPTAADFWLKPPEELCDFLKSWAEITC